MPLPATALAAPDATLAPPETSLAPLSVQRQITDFCAKLRVGQAPVYSQLLAQNILGVIRHSFPAFSAHIATDDLERFVSEFMRLHPARLPQFHDIATEVVRFAQPLVWLPRPLLCLLEYEWALLATEIDPNPTPRVVALPFDIKDIDTTDFYEQRVVSHVYAIYRTYQHVVLTRELTGHGLL